MTAHAEIQLYLLRHAHAGDPMKWHGSDDVRPLSEKGRTQAERLGFFLAEAGFEPDAILSSPKTRALDTARLVATPLEIPIRVVDALAGPLDLELVERLLDASGDPVRPLLVGHDPDFSFLAAELLGTVHTPPPDRKKSDLVASIAKLFDDAAEGKLEDKKLAERVNAWSPSNFREEKGESER